VASTYLVLGDIGHQTKDYVTAEARYRESLEAALEVTRLKPDHAYARIVQAMSQIGIANMFVYKQSPKEEIIPRLNDAGEALGGIGDTRLDDVSQRFSAMAAFSELSRLERECALFADAETHSRRGITVSEQLCQDFPAALRYQVLLSMDLYRLALIYRQMGR